MELNEAASSSKFVAAMDLYSAVELSGANLLSPFLELLQWN
jgi:hypothetical protein